MYFDTPCIRRIINQSHPLHTHCLSRVLSRLAFYIGFLVLILISLKNAYEDLKSRQKLNSRYALRTVIFEPSFSEQNRRRKGKLSLDFYQQRRTVKSTHYFSIFKKLRFFFFYFRMKKKVKNFKYFILFKYF